MCERKFKNQISDKIAHYLSHFDQEIAVAMELIDNGQLEAGFSHFIAALETLHGKVDSNLVTVMIRETENGIASAFDGFRFQNAEQKEEFIAFATQIIEELDEKHITEGATPDFVNFMNDIKHFTQNLINNF